jgi:hypothetical protein
MDPSVCSFDLTILMFESRLTRLEQSTNELTNELYHANQKINQLQEICIANGFVIPFWDSKHPPSVDNSSYEIQTAETAINCANFAIDDDDEDDDKDSGVDDDKEKDIFAQNLDFISVPSCCEDEEDEEQEYWDDLSSCFRCGRSLAELKEYEDDYESDNEDEDSCYYYCGKSFTKKSESTRDAYKYYISKGKKTFCWCRDTEDLLSLTFPVPADADANANANANKTPDDIIQHYTDLYLRNEFQNEFPNISVDEKNEYEYDPAYDTSVFEHDDDEHDNCDCYCKY